MNRLAGKLVLGLLSLLPAVLGQTAGEPPAEPPADERWSVHFQATSIGQEHGAFPSLYEGANSLPPHPERRVSLTSTAFLAYRVSSHVELVFNPELAGGKGFGQVTGIAGFTNGEMPRVTTATPALYPARGYVRIAVPLGPEIETVEDGVNQVAGSQPASRLTLVAGKFSVVDFFDINSYTHDPRAQFMNWALMTNGAWDYPADVRGYTVGAYAELSMPAWSLRLASAMEPTVANGPILDTRVARNRGNMVEWERRFAPRKHPGALRVLGFANQADAGTYLEALRSAGIPDVTTTRRDGTLKYGFGLNAEQEIAPAIGVFGRYGWNDGKTESFAFAEIDRTVSGGLSVNGCLWRRKKDQAAAAYLRNYISGDHRSYLAAGGMGFMLGDGRLDHYRPEDIVETYYAWNVIKGWTLTLDYQHVQNPAYNADRGPVSVASLRIHWER
jgi:high affinity Mn2+ porin